MMMCYKHMGSMEKQKIIALGGAKKVCRKLMFGALWKWKKLVASSKKWEGLVNLSDYYCSLNVYSEKKLISIPDVVKR